MTPNDGQVLRALRRLLQTLAEDAPDDSNAPGATQDSVDRQRSQAERDRLSQLLSFRQVVKLVSTSKAAQSLNLAAQDVLRHVRELEREMEVTLFDRHGSSLALSPAGERLYELAESLMGCPDAK